MQKCAEHSEKFMVMRLFYETTSAVAAMLSAENLVFPDNDAVR